MSADAATMAIDALAHAAAIRSTRHDTRERILVVIMYMRQDVEESDGCCASVEAGSALQTLTDVMRHESNPAIISHLEVARSIIEKARAYCRANGTLMERARNQTRYLNR
ncbi:unnamed protein product [Parajaminaea phylloscopi]